MRRGSRIFKGLETAATKSSLTPCIFDGDPEQLDQLAGLVAEMGYNSVPTGDPEEALKMVRYGRCRLVLANVHTPISNGYEFLDRALRSDPGVHVISQRAVVTPNNRHIGRAPHRVRRDGLAVRNCKDRNCNDRG